DASLCASYVRGVRRAVRRADHFFFFLQCPGAHRHLHSFPTRRSSDLPWRGCGAAPWTPPPGRTASANRSASRCPSCWPGRAAARSEEHTSELQSLRHLVCRLLLEKKKQKLVLIQLHSNYLYDGRRECD